MSKNEHFIDLVHEAVKEIGDDAIPIIEQHLDIHFENNKCCCPFHHEDTPSFIWNPKTRTAHCFGCNRNYSILNVLTDQKGSYKEALNELFRMAHMDINTYGYKPFNDGRTDWFANYIYPHDEKEPTEEHVIKYLEKRGISKDTIDYAEIKEDKYGNIAFEYRDLDNELLCVKYRPSRAIHKGETKMWFQKDASSVPMLWNIKKLDYTQPLLIQEGECFPSDVEVLTPSGWMNIAQYVDSYNISENPLICQYDTDGNLSFVYPQALIKKVYNDDLIMYDKGGYKSLTTKSHNLVYADNNLQIKKCKATELLHKEKSYVICIKDGTLLYTLAPQEYKSIPYDGMVYCVTVESGMLLVRYDGCVHVTGNCDVLSSIESGYTNACSVPNGAGSISWIEFNYDFLQNFHKIILWFDNDRAGKEGLEKILPRLGEYRCRIVKPSPQDEQMVED